MQCMVTVIHAGKRFLQQVAELGLGRENGPMVLTRITSTIFPHEVGILQFERMVAPIRIGNRSKCESSLQCNRRHPLRMYWGCEAGELTPWKSPLPELGEPDWLVRLKQN